MRAKQNRFLDLFRLNSLPWLVVFIVAVPVAGSCSEPEAGSGINSLKLPPREMKADLNFDGKVDRLEQYDQRGSLVRSETDTNHDQRMDEFVWYTNGAAERAEKDSNHDGLIDTFLEFDSAGNVSVSRSDTTVDGKIDQWVYYRNGRVRKVERDTNGNGVAETTVIYDENGTVLKQESRYDGSEKGEIWNKTDPGALLFYHDGQLY